MLKNKHGKVFIGRTLFLLGFDIDKNNPDEGYLVLDKVMVRSALCPYLIEEATIYSGRVRNEMGFDGKQIKNKPHFMKNIYRDEEVLNFPVESKEQLVDINEIGSIEPYNKGAQAMNIKVDPDKPIRQIVRG